VATDLLPDVVTFLQRYDATPYNGTLLKAQIEVQGVAAGERVQQSLERGWRWGV
jgi:hypothetical protein